MDIAQNKTSENTSRVLSLCARIETDGYICFIPMETRHADYMCVCVCVCIVQKIPAKKNQTCYKALCSCCSFVCFTRSKRVLSLFAALFAALAARFLSDIFPFRRHTHRLLNAIPFFLKFTFFSSAKPIGAIKKASTISLFTVLFQHEYKTSPVSYPEFAFLFCTYWPA